VVLMFIAEFLSGRIGSFPAAELSTPERLFLAVSRVRGIVIAIQLALVASVS